MKLASGAECAKACNVLMTARRLEAAAAPGVTFCYAPRFPLPIRHAKHVKLADEAFYIGGSAAKDSYLRGQALLDVCARAGGRSIHPGYGFLSENAAFADLCKQVWGQAGGEQRMHVPVLGWRMSLFSPVASAPPQAGVTFVGPGGDAIRAMGNKSEAKRIMSEAGVPVVPGYHGEDQSDMRWGRGERGIGGACFTCSIPAYQHTSTGIYLEMKHQI